MEVRTVSGEEWWSRRVIGWRAGGSVVAALM